jgi:two-component sensor histidine kinase
MKKLYELIAEAEEKVTTATGADKLWLYFDLSKYYMHKNSDVSSTFDDKILAADTSANREIYWRATLLKVSSLINNMDLELAGVIVHEVLSHPENENNFYIQHEANTLEGMRLYLSGDQAASQAYFEKAKQLHDKPFDGATKSMFYCSYSAVLDEINPTASYEALFTALKFAQTSDSECMQAYAYYLLGEWNLYHGSLDDAEQFLLTAFKIYDEHQATVYKGHTCRRLRAVYQRKDNIEEARKFQVISLQCLEDAGNERERVIGYTQAASFFLKINDFVNAENFIHKAIDIHAQDADEYKLGTAYSMLGDLEKQRSQFAEALKWYQKSKQAYGKTIQPNNESLIDLAMSECYEALNNFENAFSYLKKYTDTKLNYINEERQKEIVNLQTKYETEKRETELRELKIKQQQTELERSESELKAIKAQMNPHFIFNALNSIQEMFFIGDKRLANEHLGKFSQLTREILRASGKQFISLAEEIEMLTKYLELEGLRFESDFTFTIQLNDEDAADDIQLPPMLIQPYVENAIRHGLLHKQGEKRIDIQFVFDEAQKQLRCVMEDNGVGREASAEINKNRKQLHESFSTSANAKRLDLLNQNRDEKIGVVYEDLNVGTRVTITVPVNF